MDAPQIVLALFVLLLPIVLMIDFWGDERLTFRGRPVRRRWEPQVTHDEPDEH